MKLFNITKLVETILIDSPETREDDYLLWLEVLRHTHGCDISEFLAMPVGKFLAIAKYMKFPHYESVSRTRRKLQEKHPELQATAETRAARAKLEEQYREYAKQAV